MASLHLTYDNLFVKCFWTIPHTDRFTLSGLNLLNYSLGFRNGRRRIQEILWRVKSTKVSYVIIHLSKIVSLVAQPLLVLILWIFKWGRYHQIKGKIPFCWKSYRKLQVQCCQNLLWIHIWGWTGEAVFDIIIFRDFLLA